jgi:hypothetical protein
MSDPIDEKDLPDIVVKALRASKEAAAAAIAEHWRNGRPVYVWRDERVVALYPDGSAVPVERKEKSPGTLRAMKE